MNYCKSAAQEPPEGAAGTARAHQVLVQPHRRHSALEYESHAWLRTQVRQEQSLERTERGEAEHDAVGAGTTAECDRDVSHTTFATTVYRSPGLGIHCPLKRGKYSGRWTVNNY